MQVIADSVAADCRKKRNELFGGYYVGLSYALRVLNAVSDTAAKGNESIQSSHGFRLRTTFPMPMARH
jgi:hypothetical protein